MTATSRRTAKNNMFRLTKQQHCTCITLFCTFLCRHCTTTTWKCLISRSVEDVNTTERLSFSFPELWYSLLEFSSRNNCQHLTNWMRWNKRGKVWSSANSLFKWRIRSRRRRCCLSSIAKTHSRLTTAVTFSRLTDAGSRAPYRENLVLVVALAVEYKGLYWVRWWGREASKTVPYCNSTQHLFILGSQPRYVVAMLVANTITIISKN